MTAINLFFDMDGVLAEYHPDTQKLMYNKGFFRNRPQDYTAISILKDCLKENLNVFILSKVIDSPYCRQEKLEWIQEYLPEFPLEKVILVPYNHSKVDYALPYINETDKSFLIDDYTPNLLQWHWQEKGMIPIKYFNKINSRRWLDRKLPYLDHADSVTENINRLKAYLKEV